MVSPYVNPRRVAFSPPVALIVPFAVAVVSPIEDTASLVTVGTTISSTSSSTICIVPVALAGVSQSSVASIIRSKVGFVSKSIGATVATVTTPDVAFSAKASSVLPERILYVICVPPYASVAETVPTTLSSALFSASVNILSITTGS